MLQHHTPDDFVIATGESHSVREFCELAFECAHLNYEEFVTTDPSFLRPSEVDALEGDSSRDRNTIGWIARTCFEDLVKIMVNADLQIGPDSGIKLKQ